MLSVLLVVRDTLESNAARFVKTLKIYSTKHDDPSTKPEFAPEKVVILNYSPLQPGFGGIFFLYPAFLLSEIRAGRPVAN